MDECIVEHLGSCHCGEVRFSARGSPKVTVYPCNCSICVKKQIKGFIIPKERFKLLKGEDLLTLYTFNTRQAKHYFCKICGVQSFYEPRSNPGSVIPPQMSASIPPTHTQDKLRQCVMICCIDSNTIESVEEIPFDGQNWEKSIEELVPNCS